MKKIYHTAIWRSICDKTPNEKQIKYIEDIAKKHKIRSHQMRILANFCKYDVDGDWVERFFKVLDFVKQKGNVQTLEAALLKYGEKHGELIYKEVNSKKINNLEAFIKRYGEIDGKKRYDTFCKNNIGNKTIERFIKLYGEKEGSIKFQELRNKEKKKGTLLYFVDKYGEIEGKNIYNKIQQKRHSGCSKEGYIQKYGEIDGLKKFKESRENVSLSALMRRIS